MFLSSGFCGSGIQAQLARRLDLKIAQKAAVMVLAGAAVSSRGSTGEPSAHKFTHVVPDKILFFAGCLTKGISSQLAVGWGGVPLDSSLHRPLHRAAKMHPTAPLRVAVWR